MSSAVADVAAQANALESVKALGYKFTVEAKGDGVLVTGYPGESDVSQHDAALKLVSDFLEANLPASFDRSNNIVITYCMPDEDDDDGDDG